jgi:hypothetical protein
MMFFQMREGRCVVFLGWLVFVEHGPENGQHLASSAFRESLLADIAKFRMLVR